MQFWASDFPVQASISLYLKEEENTSTSLAELSKGAPKLGYEPDARRAIIMKSAGLPRKKRQLLIFKIPSPECFIR